MGKNWKKQNIYAEYEKEQQIRYEVTERKTRMHHRNSKTDTEGPYI